MSGDAPERVTQRMDALQRANRIRMNRSQLKASITDGTQTVGAVIHDVQDWSAGMPVADVLAAQYRWGQKRSLTLLRRIHVKDAATLEELTPRQRHAIWERTQ